jgi:hypothetical protein
MAKKGRKAHPVTVIKPHPVAQLSASLLADGDNGRLQTLDERAVLVLNFPGQKFSRAAMARIAGAR